MPRLNAPTILIFILSLLLAVVAIVNHLSPAVLGPYLFIPQQPFWLAIGAYVILMLGNLIRGL